MMDVLYRQVIAAYKQSELLEYGRKCICENWGGEYDFDIKLYNNGEGYRASNIFAKRVLQKLATNGNIDAMFAICNAMLDNNLCGCSYAEYLKYAKLIINSKYPASGYYFMGLAYERGYGVTPSRSTAHSYYAKGRELNNSDCIRGWNRTW